MQITQITSNSLSRVNICVTGTSLCTNLNVLPLLIACTTIIWQVVTWLVLFIPCSVIWLSLSGQEEITPFFGWIHSSTTVVASYDGTWLLGICNCFGKSRRDLHAHSDRDFYKTKILLNFHTYFHIFNYIPNIYIYMSIYICVCVYIYIYIYFNAIYPGCNFAYSPVS